MNLDSKPRLDQLVELAMLEHIIRIDAEQELLKIRFEKRLAIKSSCGYRKGQCIAKLVDG